MMSKPRAGVWRHTQPKDESTDVYSDKREEDTAAAVVVVVAHYSTAKRGSSRPGYGGTAASTSRPYPTGLGGD